MTAAHECHVWQEGPRRRWFWRCLECEASGGPYPRRMEADDATWDHQIEARA